jgi:hypothetical protein
MYNGGGHRAVEAVEAAYVGLFRSRGLVPGELSPEDAKRRQALFIYFFSNSEIPTNTCAEVVVKHTPVGRETHKHTAALLYRSN